MKGFPKFSAKAFLRKLLSRRGSPGSKKSGKRVPERSTREPFSAPPQHQAPVDVRNVEQSTASNVVVGDSPAEESLDTSQKLADSTNESATSIAAETDLTDRESLTGDPNVSESPTNIKSKKLKRERLFRGSTDADGVPIPHIERSFTDPDPSARVGRVRTAVQQDSTLKEDYIAVPLTPLNEPLSRQSSVKSLASLKNPDPIFPRTIQCSLDFTFEENPKFERCEIPDFVWYEAERYSEIKGMISKAKELLHEKEIAKREHEIYLRYASCFVKGSKNQRYYDTDDNVLIDDMDLLSDVAIRAICGFINRYPFQSFVLQFFCDFSSVDKEFTAKDGLPARSQNLSPFCIALRHVFDQKMEMGRRTVGSQQYLSLADQRKLVTHSNARRIIDEDALSKPAPLTSDQKLKLIQEISVRPALTLQAACVYELIPMNCLYHFLCEQPHLDQKLDDSVDKLRLNAGKQCGENACDEGWKRLFRSIDKFFPETIKSDFEHSIKDSKAIVPVRYVDSGKELGSGAFSNVWEVDIDPHYQLLTPDITKTYALKIFKTQPKYKAAFDREITMLLRIARYLPHEHILTHITSWEQDKVYHILYEKAHGNLREYMEQYPVADLSRDRILWFFTQLRGLSDALRRIHFFREPDADMVTGEFNFKKTGVIGRHHDIKPENILTFDLPRELPTLKISDFGSGKFSSVRAFNESSIGTAENRATRTYAGPESNKSMRKSMGRPFDLWALGCVFLELLLWFLGIEKPNGKDTFAEMRSGEEFNGPSPEQYDYFWARDSLGFFVIHPAVDYVLKKLQNKHCVGMEAFQELIDLIRQMLVIDPDKRLVILRLFNSLDAILVKARVEVTRQPTLYAKIFENNKNPEASGNLASFSSPSVNVAPLPQLYRDVSTTGESRVESATNLRNLDNPAEALRPPVSGGSRTSFRALGQQFSLGDPLGDQDLANESNDEDDTMFLKDGTSARRSLEQNISTNLEILEDKK